MSSLHPYIKAAGLKNKKEFYDKYPTPEAFFKQYPDKMQRGGIVVNEGTPDEQYDSQGRRVYSNYTNTHPNIVKSNQNIAANITPVSLPRTKRVAFENEYDAQGNLAGYQPIFQNMNYQEAMDTLRNLPFSNNNVPYERSPEVYGETFKNFIPGSNSDQWIPRNIDQYEYRKGGKVGTGTWNGDMSTYFQQGGQYVPFVKALQMEPQVNPKIDVEQKFTPRPDRSVDNHFTNVKETRGNMSGTPYGPLVPYQTGGEPIEDFDLDEFKKGGIHIKKSHEGRFTAYKKRTGKTTEEALHSKDPHVRQMANFARNAAKWKHAEGGQVINTGRGDYLIPQGVQNYYEPNMFANGGQIVNTPNGSFLIPQGVQNYYEPNQFQQGGFIRPDYEQMATNVIGTGLAVGDYFAQQKQYKDLMNNTRERGMTDSLYAGTPTPQNVKGDYVQSGSQYGQFQPQNQTINQPGMFYPKMQIGGAIDLPVQAPRLDPYVGMNQNAPTPNQGQPILSDTTLKIRKGDISTTTNNPGNMKWSPWMSHLGGVPSGIPGKDGGTFAAFPDTATGLKAYQLQLFGDTDGVFKSNYYKPNTPVDKALRTWSNNGYGAEIYPAIEGKTLGQLTQEDRDELMKRQIRRESPKMYQSLKAQNYFQQGGEYDVSDATAKRLKSLGYDIEEL
jgi:hypothetical protein